MKRMILLITLLALLSSFTYAEAELALEENNDVFYAENYQTREVPQFYMDHYDMEVPFLAVAYASGHIKDGLPQGGGTLNVYDYNRDGSLKRKMKFIGTFEDGMLVGDGQILISYEDPDAALAVREVTGTFYYGLLHGESNVIMRGFNSEINANQTLVYTGNYKFGHKDGSFTESISTGDDLSITKGDYENDVKVGEWTAVTEMETTSK